MNCVYVDHRYLLVGLVMKQECEGGTKEKIDVACISLSLREKKIKEGSK